LTVASAEYILYTDQGRALVTFLRYYTRKALFADYDSRWDYKDKPEIFWQLHFDECPALSRLADRLIHTLANSVPCERNFSLMNNPHSKARNRLTPERVDKLLYIKINRWTLNRKITVNILEIDEEDELEARANRRRARTAFWPHKLGAKWL
jgi:hAT family C-terminal dimerisation region